MEGPDDHVGRPLQRCALHWYAALRSTYGKSFMEKLARQDILVRNGSGETTDTIILRASGRSPPCCSTITWSRRCRRVPISIWLQPPEGIPASYE